MSTAFTQYIKNSDIIFFELPLSTCWSLSWWKGNFKKQEEGIKTFLYYWTQSEFSRKTSAASVGVTGKKGRREKESQILCILYNRGRNSAKMENKISGRVQKTWKKNINVKIDHINTNKVYAIWPEKIQPFLKKYKACCHVHGVYYKHITSTNNFNHDIFKWWVNITVPRGHQVCIGLEYPNVDLPSL